MKKNVMTKWVKALRSGKYKQGKELLCTDDNKFCCLGVLCDLYQKNAKKNKKAQLDFHVDEDVGCKVYSGESKALPTEVMDWAGLRSPVGTTIGIKSTARYASYDSLAVMNDNGLKFKTIANFIEEHYKEL